MSDRSKYLFWSLTLLAVIAGILHAYSLRYVNDDCFVSFRYAKNLVHGLGLVYNAEERVEGYTNFLWTILIAGGMKLGLDPVPLSMAAGIFFFVLSLLLFAVMSSRMRIGTNPSFLAIPLTTIALCLHRDFSAHATSGMETSMYACFVSAAFLLLSANHSRTTLLGAGLALVLAMMTRPDGVVFLAAMLVYLLLVAEKPMRACLLLLSPTVVLFVPYWLLRYQYFAHFLPNAFYAKSVALPYYRQGMEYLWLYFKTYYIMALLPILAAVALARYGGRLREIIRTTPYLRWFRTADDSARPAILAVCCTAAYLAFVVRLGGDFMFARFLIPVTPMIYYLIELLVRKLAPTRIGYALVALLIIGTVLRNNQYRDRSFVGYVADEARYFTVDEPLERSQAQATLLAGYFRGMPVRVAVWAGQLRLAYYLDPSYAIESSGGITDSTVAHQHITERGRPGHEKKPSPEYLMKRNVQFYLGPTDPPPPGQFVLNMILFDSLRGRIITYHNAIMEKLAEHPGVTFVHLPEYLDTYIARMKTFPAGRVAQDYAYFKAYYFDHNSDPARQHAFLSYLLPGVIPPMRGNPSPN